MAAEAATPKIEEDWQFNKSVAECNRHMLENGIDTDVTFLVSDSEDSEAETISAHKYMLISRSPVFNTMLCGDGPLVERGTIRVTDVHPKAFREMLSYIYMDDLELNVDLVPHVINASTKYRLPGLTSKCAEFLKDHLDAENVCTILDQIHIFEQTDICLNFIMNETKKVLESEAFLSISYLALSKVLDIESCEVKELDVFKACLKWARKKCVQQKKEATGKNTREVLAKCIYKFRFSSIIDFAREVCPEGVFTQDEEHRLFRHLANMQVYSAPDGFSCTARLRPIYIVLTTEQSQKTEFQELEFNITIDCNCKNDIEVNKLLIGKSPNIQMDRYSIKYNDTDINGKFSSPEDEVLNEEMLQFQCNSPLIIKPGSSTLQITYKEIERFKITSAYVYGVPMSEITLKDGDRVELKLSTSKAFIPLLGIGYQVVLKYTHII